MENSEKMFWTGLSPDEARAALVKKDKSMRDKRMSLKEAIDRFVKSGANVAFGGFVDIRQAIASAHELIRHGFRDLTLSFQSAGMGPDVLAGAMIARPDHCSIRRVELAYWAHEGYGLSPVCRVMAEQALIEFEDWSNYNMSARFKAGALGIPFMPCRGPMGSDILKTSRTRVIDCPFTGRKISLVPASHPNVALLHVQAADKFGNCVIRGSEGTDPEIAMASEHTIITCEQLVSHELMATRPNDIVIHFAAVDAVVQVPFGAYPGACHRHYYFSERYIHEFTNLVTPIIRGGSTEALKAWYDEYVFGVNSFEEYLAKLPSAELLKAQLAERENYEAFA